MKHLGNRVKKYFLALAPSSEAIVVERCLWVAHLLPAQGVRWLRAEHSARAEPSGFRRRLQASATA